MLRISGAQDFPIQIPQPDREVVLGDNGPMATFSYEAGEFPSGTINAATNDSGFKNFAQGTLARDYSGGSGNSEWTVGQPSGNSKPTMLLFAQREAKKWEVAARGDSAWEYMLAAASEIDPGGASLTQRQHSPYAYNFSLSSVTQTPWGDSLNNTNWQCVGGVVFEGQGDYPFYLHAAVGDGTQTDFTIPVTVPTDGDLFIFVDGSPQAETTDYTTSESSGTTTIAFEAASTPADGAIINILAQTTKTEIEALDS
jgi:hypothetical protein